MSPKEFDSWDEPAKPQPAKRKENQKQ
jgi:hypothetical protein